MTPRHICRDIGVQPLPPSQKRVLLRFFDENFSPTLRYKVYYINFFPQSTITSFTKYSTNYLGITANMTARHICRDFGVQTLPPSQKHAFFGFRRERFTNLEI